jgi:hypothetical protein
MLLIQTSSVPIFSCEGGWVENHIFINGISNFPCLLVYEKRKEIIKLYVCPISEVEHLNIN